VLTYSCQIPTIIISYNYKCREFAELGEYKYIIDYDKIKSKQLEDITEALMHYFLGKNLTSAEYGIVGTIITIINFGYLFLNNGVRQAVSKEISLNVFNTADDIHVNYISEDEIISNIQEAGGCGIIYSEKALDNIYQLENYWHVTDVLSQVEGTIWIYGENYADFLANKGYILE
jgi:hypothetical protein